MKCREFTEQDLKSVYEIIEFHVKNTFSKIYSEPVVNYYLEYHSKDNYLKRAKEGSSVVVEINNTIVGTGNLLKNYISTIFVHPLFIGKGIGRFLLKNLEDIAKKNKIKTIYLDAIPGRSYFFKQQNYKVISEATDTWGGGIEIKYIKMKKNLENSY